MEQRNGLRSENGPFLRCMKIINKSIPKHNMKSFLNFLTEATESQAAMQAKKLGLKGDGHGGWIDRAGKVVARTEKGKLKFTEKRTSKGQEEPEADTQKSAAPAPTTKNKSSTSTCTRI
jgi:hypothetical protein